MSVRIKGVSSVQIKLNGRKVRKYESGLHAMAGGQEPRETNVSMVVEVEPEEQSLTSFTLGTYFVYLLICAAAVVFFSFK